MKLNKEKVLPIIKAALKEDIGSGDITTQSLTLGSTSVKAYIFAKESGVIAGLNIAKWTFELLGKEIKFVSLVRDGKQVKRFEKIAMLKGPAALILKGERTALNFLCHLSGIATLTRSFVKKISGIKVKIFDTRKTTPILRLLEKYAVRVGGGYNHRMGLWDGVLIKNNHLESLKLEAGTPNHSLRSGTGHGWKLEVIKKAIRIMKEKGYKKIEIEVRNLKEFKEALASGADIIMLDNMRSSDIKKAVKLRNSFCLQPSAFSLQPLIEVSGGITLQNVRLIAELGVDMISIGALTHSAPALDLSLKILPRLSLGQEIWIDLI